jgi:hypothetical protein
VEAISEAIREAIGCQYFDVVRLTDTWDMWLDDEGMFSQPINRYATALAHRYGRVHQPYWGTVLFATADANGDTLGLTPEQAAAVRAQLTGLGISPPISVAS